MRRCIANRTCVVENERVFPARFVALRCALDLEQQSPTPVGLGFEMQRSRQAYNGSAICAASTILDAMYSAASATPIKVPDFNEGIHGMPTKYKPA